MIPVTGKTRLLVSGYMGFQRTAQPLVAGRSGWVGRGMPGWLRWLGRAGQASDTFRRFPRHGKKKEEQGQEQKQHSGEPPGWTSPLPHFDLTDLIHAWRGSTVSTKVDTYQEPPVPTAAGNCRGWGGVGWQDRWRHGWRHRAPMDGFTACPASPHRPAQPAETQSRFGFGFGFGFGSGSGFGLCRCRAQPCRTPSRCARRARPGATRNEKAAFRRLSHYFSLISRRRSSRKPWAVIGSGYRLGFSGVMHDGSTSIRKSGFGCRKNGTE